MSAPLVRLQPQRNAVLPAAETASTKYWKSYRAPLLAKENSAINHVHFSPAAPHDLAYTSASRIQILSSKTQQVYKSLTRFKDTVYCGEFRHDGRMIVAGDATGVVRAFDTASRSTLVTLQPTQHATHVTKFHPTSLSTLLTASDDRVVRLWDLTTPDPINEFDAHGDYVRSATFMANSQIVATGCYDGFLRIFDPRISSSRVPVAEFAHRDPIDAVLSLNSTTVVTAAGAIVSVWDLTSGRKIRSMCNFQKTVTCLANAGDNGFLAGSLDGHVKVFGTDEPNFPVKFSWKFGAPVLSVALSPDGKQLATGLTSGLLAVRTRKTEPKTEPIKAQPKAKAFSRIIRGHDYNGEYEHQTYKPTGKPNIKLKPYEKHFKAFRWSDALDAAFAQGVLAEQTLMVLGELRANGKVSVALANRDEESLEPLFKWCKKHVHDTRAVPLITDYIGAVLDMYTDFVIKCPSLVAMLHEIRESVKEEIEVAEDMQRMKGMLQLLIAA